MFEHRIEDKEKEQKHEQVEMLLLRQHWTRTNSIYNLSFFFTHCVVKMAVALSSCTSLSSVLFSTVKFRCSFGQRPIIASIRCNHSHRLSSSSSKSNRQKEGAGHKKQHSKDERPSRGNVVEPQPTSSKAFGILRKNKEMFDSKDQQVYNTILPFLLFSIEFTWFVFGAACKMLK